MAKNGKSKYLGYVIPLVLLLASIVGTFVWTQADVRALGVKDETIEKDVTELKMGGCAPSGDNEKAIIAIKKDMEYIKKGIDRIEEKL